MSNSAIAQEIFVTGLKNAHAMEKQAMSIMQPQLKRLRHYREVASMLDRHIKETEGQIDRLEQILGSLNESASGLKDTALSASGVMAALTHTVADDEILKNSMVNFAFEHFEIAAYTSLIAVARVSGETSGIPLLEQNLEEERRMAAWIGEHLPTVTEEYLTLKASGERAAV